MYFDSAKARNELGYMTGSLDDGLARAIAFFRATGMARSAAAR
jgi:nucleoside-diphosphate-sugar epimerase